MHVSMYIFTTILHHNGRGSIGAVGPASIPSCCRPVQCSCSLLFIVVHTFLLSSSTVFMFSTIYCSPYLLVVVQYSVHVLYYLLSSIPSCCRPVQCSCSLLFIVVHTFLLSSSTVFMFSTIYCRPYLLVVVQYSVYVLYYLLSSIPSCCRPVQCSCSRSRWHPQVRRK